MTKAKTTKLDKEIQKGLYDLKKPATVYIITDAKGNKKKVDYAKWLKWMKEQKQLYDPPRINKHWKDSFIKLSQELYKYPREWSSAHEMAIFRAITTSKTLYEAARKLNKMRAGRLTKTQGLQDAINIVEQVLREMEERQYDPKASSLPPTRWYEAMVKGIKKSSDVRNPYAVVKSIWQKLSPSKRSEIKAREKKGERFRYDLPLPVDKPTRGIGTVRMVKPFKLAEVQVNMSVKDYLVARASGLFQRMKRQDGTMALVARCKSPEKNVNVFVDKIGGK